MCRGSMILEQHVFAMLKLMMILHQKSFDCIRVHKHVRLEDSKQVGGSLEFDGARASGVGVVLRTRRRGARESAERL